MRATALVVDVAESTLRAHRQALEDAGFDVVTASSFTEGSTLLAQVRPDLLVAAVRLDTYNGVHLAIRSQSLSPSTRVLIVGYPDPVIERDAADAGAVYLPVWDAKTLVDMAVKIVRQPGGHAANAKRAGGRGH